MSAQKDKTPTHQLLLMVLGIVGNLLLGGITYYVAELRDDLTRIADIARTGVANSALIAKDVANNAEWTVYEIRELKERVKALERK